MAKAQRRHAGSPSDRSAGASGTVVQGTRRGMPRLNEEPSRELRFEQGDERSGRVGDPRSRRQLRDEFPPARVREAGHSGGETADHAVTADDMAPETLLDEERSRTPDARRGRAPRDTDLTQVADDAIGGGVGADEAELAEREPIGRREASALRRKTREHAKDANFFERYETEELAAAARARRDADADEDGD